MANRDYKKIERTIRDFCMNVGGGSPSKDEVAIVDTLPETAKEGDLAVLKSEIIDPEYKDVSDVELKLYEVTDTNGPKMIASQIVVYPDEYAFDDFYNAINKCLGREDNLLNIESYFVSQSEFDDNIQRMGYTEFEKDTDLVGKPAGNYYRALGTKTILDLIINQFFTPGEDEGMYQEWLSGDFLPYNGLLMKIEITGSKYRVAYRDYELDLETGNIALYTEWEISPEDEHDINLAPRTNQCYNPDNLDDRALIDTAISSSLDGTALATLTIAPLDKEYTYALYQYTDGEWVEQGDSGEGNPDGVKVIKFESAGGGEYYINSTKLKEYIVAKYGEEELSESLYDWGGSGSSSYCMLFSGETNSDPEGYINVEVDDTGFELFDFSGDDTSRLYVRFFNGAKYGSVTGSSIYNVGNFIDLFSSIHGIILYEEDPKYYIYNNLTLFIQYYIRRDSDYVTHNIVVDLTEEEAREIFNTRK